MRTKWLASLKSWYSECGPHEPACKAPKKVGTARLCKWPTDPQASRIKPVVRLVAEDCEIADGSLNYSSLYDSEATTAISQ